MAGAMLDDDDEPPLELALDHGRPARKAASLPPGPNTFEDDDGPGVPLELAVPGLHAGAPGAPQAAAPAPAGQGIAAAATPIAGAVLAAPEAGPSEDEIFTFAAYGPPPTSLAGAPGYAVRVFRRRQRLQQKLRVARRTRDGAKAAADQVLAAAMEALRDGAPPTHPLAHMFETLRGYDAVQEAAHDASAEIARQQAAARQSLHGELEQLQGQKATADVQAATAEAEVERAAQARARVEARIKRVEIELRAAHEAARLAAGQGAQFAPPEHAARIQALEAERAQRGTELAEATRALSALEVRAREKRAVVRGLRRQTGDKAKVTEEQERAARDSLRAGERGVESARGRRLVAYADAGREVLRARPQELSTAQVDRAREVEAQLGAAERALELCVRALDAADRDWERKGWAILVGVPLLLILALIILSAAR